MRCKPQEVAKVFLTRRPLLFQFDDTASLTIIAHH